MGDVGVYPESMQEDLRKSPSGNFVSRQWLLDEYDKRHNGPPGGARKMIEEAPPADVRPVKWIPVTERLPDKERKLIEKVNGEERPVSWWKAMAYHLADRLKQLGDFCEVEGR